tara:strand:- start:76 stop:225 length:150 start_codon:yes stop_codon:yes gene_type:complete
MEIDYKYLLVLPTIFSVSIIGSMIKEYITLKYFSDNNGNNDNNDNKKED